MDTATRTEGRVLPWNKGKLLGQKPPLKLKEIWAIRIRLQLTHQPPTSRYLISPSTASCADATWSASTFTMWPKAVGSSLARCVMQKKSQRPVQFEITEQTRDAVSAWIGEAHLKPDQYLFPSRVSESPHLRLGSTPE